MPRKPQGPVAAHLCESTVELSQVHARLRNATGTGAARVTVAAVTPPDVIGLFVLLPSER